MKLIKHILSLLLIFLVESCTINSNRMLRTQEIMNLMEFKMS